MSFFKKLFGSKNNKTSTPNNNESILDIYKKVPWMTDMRLKNLTICLKGGFRPASSLPTELGRELRPALEIAKRLHAIKALVFLVNIPPENEKGQKILDHISENKLEDFMTEDEKSILDASRDNEQLRNSIGWKFENAWPLAWYFGYKAPEITGEMMPGEQMVDIMTNYTCTPEQNVEEWVKTQDTISDESLIEKEDLFYCVHNAVRSAQMGRDTVPSGFDPMGNGGVIHERRHALTWMLSKGISWEDTDLST
ncbi:DUF4272 domain-containing protein [Winogradskyella sp.]|uniref:DUF4272 domain-containing protein n=1 Tax=Winogradskyella sp. TaxID=1883156 RepID=UPI003BAA40CE